MFFIKSLFHFFCIFLCLVGWFFTGCTDERKQYKPADFSKSRPTDTLGKVFAHPKRIEKLSPQLGDIVLPSGATASDGKTELQIRERSRLSIQPGLGQVSSRDEDGNIILQGVTFETSYEDLRQIVDPEFLLDGDVNQYNSNFPKGIKWLTGHKEGFLLLWDIKKEKIHEIHFLGGGFPYPYLGPLQFPEEYDDDGIVHINDQLINIPNFRSNKNKKHFTETLYTFFISKQGVCPREKCEVIVNRSFYSVNISDLSLNISSENKVLSGVVFKRSEPVLNPFNYDVTKRTIAFKGSDPTNDLLLGTQKQEFDQLTHQLYSSKQQEILNTFSPLIKSSSFLYLFAKSGHVLYLTRSAEKSSRKLKEEGTVYNKPSSEEYLNGIELTKGAPIDILVDGNYIVFDQEGAVELLDRQDYHTKVLRELDGSSRKYTSLSEKLNVEQDNIKNLRDQLAEEQQTTTQNRLREEITSLEEKIKSLEEETNSLDVKIESLKREAERAPEILDDQQIVLSTTFESVYSQMQKGEKKLFDVNTGFFKDKPQAQKTFLKGLAGLINNKKAETGFSKLITSYQGFNHTSGLNSYSLNLIFSSPSTNQLYFFDTFFFEKGERVAILAKFYQNPLTTKIYKAQTEEYLIESAQTKEVRFMFGLEDPLKLHSFVRFDNKIFASLDVTDYLQNSYGRNDLEATEEKKNVRVSLGLDKIYGWSMDDGHFGRQIERSVIYLTIPNSDLVLYVNVHSMSPKVNETGWLEEAEVVVVGLSNVLYSDGKAGGLVLGNSCFTTDVQVSHRRIWTFQSVQAFENLLSFIRPSTADSLSLIDDKSSSGCTFRYKNDHQTGYTNGVYYFPHQKMFIKTHEGDIDYFTFYKEFSQRDLMNDLLIKNRNFLSKIRIL